MGKSKKVTKKSKKEQQRDAMYHNTRLLLKKYRDVSWSLNVAVTNTKRYFQREYGLELDDFLDSVYDAGIELSGSKFETRTKEIEKTRDMLALIDESVELIRKNHRNGKEYYLILYYTYLCPEALTTEQIVYRLKRESVLCSGRTYYRKRKEAIEVLGSVLWGYADGITRAAFDKIDLKTEDIEFISASVNPHEH